jgi:cholesterol oxidase
MSQDYDYIIIGSGFGGSVSALRLSEKGYKVLVIEKGKDYRDLNFAKNNWNLKKWLWMPWIKFFGIQQLTFFRHVNILSGVGVGGGSLVYANTLPKPKSQFFHHGPWKNLDTWEDKLAPFYELAWKMLGAKKNPKLFDADLALKELSKDMGKSDSFETPKVAVYFGKEGQKVDDPYFNGEGPQRVGCTFCGACMTGCRVGAKNTLDKNYLHLAENKGAKILAETKVIDIIPQNEDGSEGYEVITRKSTRWFSSKKKLKAKGIIFSAGVLGTVPLMLKLKEKNLPKLSPRLGETIRTNNEALILNVSHRDELDLSKGVAIGSLMEVDEHSHLETVRYGKGSNFWKLMMLPLVNETSSIKRITKLILKFIQHPIRSMRSFLKRDFASHNTVSLFMQHLDSTLKLTLGGIYGVKTKIDKGEAPSAFIPQAMEITKRLSKILNSDPHVLNLESIKGTPSTAHILGGACMGESEKEGVIDKDNKVFNYENMFVFDGSMISANPGVNPSLSITAITEYGMSKIPEKT